MGLVACPRCLAGRVLLWHNAETAFPSSGFPFPNGSWRTEGVQWAAKPREQGGLRKGAVELILLAATIEIKWLAS